MKRKIKQRFNRLEKSVQQLVQDIQALKFSFSTIEAEKRIYASEKATRANKVATTRRGASPRAMKIKEPVATKRAASKSPSNLLAS